MIAVCKQKDFLVRIRKTFIFCKMSSYQITFMELSEIDILNVLFYFCIYLFFKTRSSYVALVGLELTMVLKLALNWLSRPSTSLEL